MRSVGSFVYEGLWKLNTLSTAKPWTSAGYLRNARGPIRNVYREMTGDPDDLHWLDYDAGRRMRGTPIQASFLAQHPDLTDEQKAQPLAKCSTVRASSPSARPSCRHGFKIAGQPEKVISYDAETSC